MKKGDVVLVWDDNCMPKNEGIFEQQLDDGRFLVVKPMDTYQAWNNAELVNDWILHNGDCFPDIHPETEVEVSYRNGVTYINEAALMYWSQLNEESDIIKWRKV